MNRPISALALLVVPLAALSQDPWPKRIDADMKAGYALLDKGKANEAAQKFNAAMEGDPLSSWPYSGMAELYLMASQHTAQEHVVEYRGKAEQFALDALERNDLDFHATNVLTQLRGGSMASRHQPKPEAEASFNEAEKLFNAGKFTEAVPLYQQALNQDPGFTNAALYLGDAWFRQDAFDKAELFFRKATELEPNYARAWRFLGDCYGRMDRLKDAEHAALGAIAADPGDFTAWARLRQVREATSKPKLNRYTWPKVQVPEVSRDTKGKDGVSVSLSVPPGDRPEDHAAMNYQLVRMLGSALAAQGSDSAKPGGNDSPCRAELSAWTSALELLDSVAKEKKKEPKDKAWLQLRAIKQAGELEAALLLLQYREAYRPEFEAWKKAHPGGVESFIDTWQLRP
jgi:tetratricopeptide (TPR) repeat protein